jgi:hypothetical protein
LPQTISAVCRSINKNKKTHSSKVKSTGRSDCKPFDYFVWGVTELRVKAKPRNKSKDLIQKMKEVMGSLARDTLAKACTSFRSRIEGLFTADGTFI